MEKRKNVINNLVTCGIYCLKGIKYKDQVKIKHIDTIKTSIDNRITDTFIESYTINKNITGQIFACSLTNNFLSSTKKLPMIYIDVWWTRVIQRKLLYRLFLYFTIKEEVKSSKQLINCPLKGIFSIEVSIEDQLNSLDEINIYPGNKEIKDILINFTKSKNMKLFHKQLSDLEEKKIADKYKNEFKDYEKIPKATIKLKDYLDK